MPAPPKIGTSTEGLDLDDSSPIDSFSNPVFGFLEPIFRATSQQLVFFLLPR